MKKQLTCQCQASVCSSLVLLVCVYIYMGEVKEKYCERLNESWTEVICITFLLKNFLIYVSQFTVWKRLAVCVNCSYRSTNLDESIVSPFGTIKIYVFLVLNRVHRHVTHVAVYCSTVFKFHFTFMSVEIRSFIFLSPRTIIVLNKFPADVYTPAMSKNNFCLV